MNAKIRTAQIDKIPYILVVGDREQEAGTVAVRLRTKENLGALALNRVIERMTDAVAAKATI
jgi:threonyl-tRNA synthetase